MGREHRRRFRIEVDPVAADFIIMALGFTLMCLGFVGAIYWTGHIGNG